MSLIYLIHNRRKILPNCFLSLMAANLNEDFRSMPLSSSSREAALAPMPPGEGMGGGGGPGGRGERGVVGTAEAAGSAS